MKKEGSTQKTKNRDRRQSTTIGTKVKKVSFKQNLKHFENRLNRRKDRNEGDKKGNSFVWGSGRRGGIITYTIIFLNAFSNSIATQFQNHTQNFNTILSANYTYMHCKTS